MRALCSYNQEQQYPVGPWPGTDSCRGSRCLHFVEKISAEKISAGIFSMVFAKTMPPKKKQQIITYLGNVSFKFLGTPAHMT